MVDLFGVAMALIAVILLSIAVTAMFVGSLQIAGLSFLSASLVLYLRER